MKKLWLVLPLLCLLGCDKGRTSLNKLVDTYGDPQKLEISDANLEQARVFLMGLNIVALAHPTEGSGRDAKKMAEELRVSAQKYVDSLEPKRIELVNAVNTTAAAWQDAALAFKKKWIRKNPSFKFLHQKGDCVAQYVGSEFEKEKAAMGMAVHVFRIEEIGQSEVLLRTLYSPSESLTLKDPETALKQLSPEPKGEAKVFVANYSKADCTQADALAAKYKALLEAAIDYRKFAQKLMTAQALAARAQ